MLVCEWLLVNLVIRWNASRHRLKTPPSLDFFFFVNQPTQVRKMCLSPSDYVHLAQMFQIRCCVCSHLVCEKKFPFPNPRNLITSSRVQRAHIHIFIVSDFGASKNERLHTHTERLTFSFWNDDHFENIISTCLSSYSPIFRFAQGRGFETVSKKPTEFFFWGFFFWKKENRKKVHPPHPLPTKWRLLKKSFILSQFIRYFPLFPPFARATWENSKSFIFLVAVGGLLLKIYV